MTPLSSRQRLSTAAVLSAMALVVVDGGAVNLALASIAADLRQSPAHAVMVATGYQLAVLIGLLPCAHLAERFGARDLFKAGVMTFGIGALASALAPNLPVLLAGRFIQGLGGAAILALGIALLRAALGTARLGQAIAWNALTVSLSAAAGPALGAVALSLAGWRALFLADLPIACVALVAAVHLPRIEPVRTTVAGWSILLFAAGGAAAVTGAGLAATQPLPGAALLLTGLACIAALLVRERADRAPLVPLDLLGGKPFRTSVAASVLCFTAVSAGLIAIPLHLQLNMGLSAGATGLLATAWPLATGVSSQLANRLSARSSATLPCAVGAMVLGAGLIVSSLQPAGAPLPVIALGLVLCGSGFALFQVPNNRSMFLAAPAERSAAAGGMQGTARLAGQTTGALLVSLLLGATSPAQAPHLALAAAAAFALGAAVVSLSAAGTIAAPVGTMLERKRKVPDDL